MERTSEMRRYPTRNASVRKRQGRNLSVFEDSFKMDRIKLGHEDVEWIQFVGDKVP
jgi:hypothetical protein